MINFGIIGAGDIARKFADAVRHTENGKVIAIASKSLEKAKNWAKKENIENYYGNYEELLNNSDIDAIYIATTTNFHYENIKQCLHAGKHVICEKSLVRSYDEAKEVFELAKKKKLFLMEAMWTRFLPKTKKVKEWIHDNKIGKVKFIQATIGWKADPVYNKRLFAPELGGGSMYDIGIYPLEMIPYFADEKIMDMQFFMTPSASGVDDMVSMNLKLESCLANLQCSFTTKMPEDAYIYGEDGYIRIPKLHYGNKAFLYDAGDNIIETFEGGSENGFIYEVEEAIHCISQNKLESDICPHEMTLDAAKWTDMVIKLL